MKRISAILLTAVMIFSCFAVLASCGPGEEVVSTIVDGKFDPPITLTWAYPFVGADNTTISAHTDADGNADWTNSDTSWTRLAKSNYGIKMVLEWDVNDPGAYMTKLDNEILVGSIPDFVNVLYGETAVNYIKKLYLQDLIQPLDEVIEQYACDDYKNTVEYVGEQVFYSSTYGGKIYGLPHVLSGNAKNVVYWMRTDWLDNVNKSVPTNYEEFREILLAFTNQDPDGNQLKDTYGLAINLADDCSNSNIFFNMWGAYPGDWILGDDGKLVYGSTTEKMKDAIAELRDLYAAGAIFPLTESANALNGGCYEGITLGKAGVMESTTNYVNVFKNLKKDNPDVDFASFMPFSAIGEEIKLSASTNTFRQYVISADCKYPAAAVLLMNMFCEIEAAAEDDMSVQTEYLYSADGKYHFYNLAPCITQRYTGTESIASRVLEALKTSDTSMLKAGQDQQVYDYVKDYLDTGNIDNWYWERMYGIDGANHKYGDFVADHELVRTYYQGATTDGMALNWGTIRGLLTQTVVDIVTGISELDTFDTCIAQWYDQGGQTITDEVNEWYSAMTGEAE